MSAAAPALKPQPVLVLPLPRNTERTVWAGLHGSARGLAIAECAQRSSGPLVVLTHDARGLRRLEAETRFYAGAENDLPVLTLPDWESLPYDRFSPHPDIVSERLRTLARLPTLDRGVVFLAATTAMHRLPPPGYVGAHSFNLDVGGRLDIGRFREQLEHAGYRHAAQVIEPGEYAIRGGLFDVYPMGAETPYRIDLFGDEIEAIRVFDPDTQRSGDKQPGVHLLPAREYPATPEGIARFRQAFRARFEGDPQKAALYREVSKGQYAAGVEYFLPLFFERVATLADYLPGSATIVMEDGAADSAAAFRAEAESRYELLRHDLEHPILPPDAPFLRTEEFNGMLSLRPRIMLREPDPSVAPAADDAAPTRAPPVLAVNHRADEPYLALLQHLREFPGRILLVAETTGRREVLLGVLKNHDLHPVACASWADFLARGDRFCLCVAPLERGLLLEPGAISVVTEPQLYGERAAQRRSRAARVRDTDAIIRNLAELRRGDPVVHEDHGVGRYLGLQVLDVGDGVTEFLTLEYQGGDKLYVPVTDLERIHRYTGLDPETAPLHKLGGDAWDRAKDRAREKAHDAAVEILEVQARRSSREGFAFAPRGHQYDAFTAAFPFEETPDQERAIGETLADMETGKPMDRLVCGDVGFGKTEVAMRAAFLAVQGGRQVAVLVPTTLLADQHFRNFSDRFADYPVRIELLSRFRSKREQDVALGDIADGKVDIAIGTHRLLQEDVCFQRLGLVIIDEEHRFGVRQKERLKKLRAEVDVLTMTATPIPRTLNFALAGLRDISLIATAPESRVAVKTFVTQWNDVIVREAIVRELRRGGQVFFLHNDVRTIERARERIGALVPEAEARIAHGQMPERELERAMLDFYHQRFNVLVCSTIIESGIDIPTANTIIIERADKFGLAQLHQLRGRVGRSHHRAWCYLIIPPKNLLSADAQKRLDAIASLEELGAGFALASHDLEIRGAGELLGEEQSGQIDEVGFTLYTELLQRAVAALKRGDARAVESPDSRGIEVALHAPALLPADYVEDVALRLVLYKRIAEADSREFLEDREAEIVDRFGPLPDPAKRLFRVAALKLRAAPFGIRRIEAGPKGARIEFYAQARVEPAAIIRLLQGAPRVYRMDGPTRLRVTKDMPDATARIAAIEEFLSAL